MPLLSSLLPIALPATIETRRYQLFLKEVREATGCIKSLDPKTRTLTILPWLVTSNNLCFQYLHISRRPVRDTERVVPSELEEHRKSHQFLGPCCLCPLFEPQGRPIFTEAAIFIATSGPFAGEYIAKCAKGDCGYLGQVLCNG